MVVAQVDDGGDLFFGWIRFFLLRFGFLVAFLPGSMIGAMVSWVVLVGFVAACSSSAFPTTNLTDLSPLLPIWNPAVPRCSGWSRPPLSSLSALWSLEVLEEAGGVSFILSQRFGGRPRSTPVVMVVFGRFAELCRRLRWVSVWFVWFGLGFSPEFGPVLYCLTGVGSSFSVLFVVWATGVGSGWAISLYALLYGFSQWCHVIVTVKRLRSGVEIGSSAVPKGVVDFGVSLMPKGVTCAGPSGIIILLTLVSGLSSRGFNPCSALRPDVLTVVLYVTIVSVIVSLTLIIYHMFIVALL